MPTLYNTLGMSPTSLLPLLRYSIVLKPSDWGIVTGYDEVAQELNQRIPLHIH